MNELTHNEYWTEINELAESMVSECMDECENDREAAEELINDSRLHETVDGHQWVIYYGYNLDVIKHSDNEDYYDQNFGADAVASSLEQGGLDTLHCHIAFWCMYADIQDIISDKFDEYKDNIEAA